MTHETNEEHIDSLKWIFVPGSGNSQTLSSSGNGGKYTITQTDEGSKVKSQLIVNSLQTSDEGSYYCQAEFSNGTTLPRSQEITLFPMLVYNGDSPCEESMVESTKTTRCVLFTNEVVQPMPTSGSTEAPSSTAEVKNATDSPTSTSIQSEIAATTKNETQITTATVDGGGVTSAMAPNQNGETKEGGGGGGGDSTNDISIGDIFLYLAIGAAVLLVIIISVLVLCICLCNRACDCCQFCS